MPSQLLDSSYVIADYDGDDTLLATYVTPGLDANLSQTRSGSTYYYMADGLGSIRNLVNGAEGAENVYDYYAFGKELGSWTENVTNRYTYTAREYDAESAQYYYRARYYRPELATFTSRDPRSPYRYTYVSNDPVNLYDPQGMAASGWQDHAEVDKGVPLCKQLFGAEWRDVTDGASDNGPSVGPPANTGTLKVTGLPERNNLYGIGKIKYYLMGPDPGGICDTVFSFHAAARHDETYVEAWWGPRQLKKRKMTSYQVSVGFPESSRLRIGTLELGFMDILAIGLDFEPGSGVYVGSPLPISAKETGWTMDFKPVILLEKTRETIYKMTGSPYPYGPRASRYDREMKYHVYQIQHAELYTGHAAGKVCARCTPPEDKK